MNFGLFKTILMIIVLLGSIAISILDILMIVGVGSLATSSIAVASISLVAAVLISICALLLIFNSYYKFKDQYLLIVLGFFCDKLNYDNIVNIKQNSITKEIYLIYNSENEEDLQNIRLN